MHTLDGLASGFSSAGLLTASILALTTIIMLGYALRTQLRLPWTALSRGQVPTILIALALVMMPVILTACGSGKSGY